MPQLHKSQRFPAIAFALTVVTATAAADNPWASFGSGPGNDLFLAAGILLPLLQDRPGGEDRAFRNLDAVTSSGLLAELLKNVARVPRPDTGEHDSFPSGHATAAFAVATMQSAEHHSEALLWYGGAALISESRLALGRHRPLDVLAGGALGYFTARLELSSRHGIIFRPWIGRSGSFGLSMSATF